MTSRFRNAALLVLPVAMILSCQKGKPADSKGATDGGGTDGGTTDGKTDSDTSTEDKTKDVAAPGVTIAGTVNVSVGVDTVVPFHLGGAKLDATQTAAAQATPIVNGQVALSVTSGSGSNLTDGPASTVVMMMKKAATPLEAFESMTFVGAATAGDETLINLATSDAKVDEIQLGEITKNGDDLVSANEVGVDQFELPAAALAEMAKVDDSLRILKNQYANTKQGATAKGSLEFYWDANTRDALNQELTPDKLAYQGWSPGLQFDHDEFKFDVLCDASLPTFKEFVLAVPSPGVKRDANDATFITQLSNAGAAPNMPGGNSDGSCGAGSGISNTYIRGGTTTNKAVYMNFGGGDQFQTAIPKGVWTVTLGGDVKAKFDLGVSEPFQQDPSDAAKRVPRVYVPTFKITTDPTTHKIQKAEVWFNLYDLATGTYKKLTDYDTMKRAVYGFELSAGQNNGSGQIHAEKMAAADVYPANGQPWVMDFTKLASEWRVSDQDREDCPDPASGYKKLDELVLDYIMAENRYKFWVRLPSDGNFGVGCPP